MTPLLTSFVVYDKIGAKLMSDDLPPDYPI